MGYVCDSIDCSVCAISSCVYRTCYRMSRCCRYTLWTLLMMSVIGDGVSSLTPIPCLCRITAVARSSRRDRAVCEGDQSAHSHHRLRYTGGARRAHVQYGGYVILCVLPTATYLLTVMVPVHTTHICVSRCRSVDDSGRLQGGAIQAGCAVLPSADGGVCVHGAGWTQEPETSHQISHHSSASGVAVSLQGNEFIMLCLRAYVLCEVDYIGSCHSSLNLEPFMLW